MNKQVNIVFRVIVYVLILGGGLLSFEEISYSAEDKAVVVSASEPVRVKFYGSEAEAVRKAMKKIKKKIYQTALIESMEGDGNTVFRRDWNNVGLDSVVISNPTLYFYDFHSIDKERRGDDLVLRASIKVKRSALRDLINKKPQKVKVSVELSPEEQEMLADDEEDEFLDQIKQKLYIKALRRSLKGKKNKDLKEAWDEAVDEGEEEVGEESGIPEIVQELYDNADTYFIGCKVCDTNSNKAKIEVIVNVLAVREELLVDYLDEDADNNVNLNLAMLFLARSASKQIDYGAEVDARRVVDEASKEDIVEDEEGGVSTKTTNSERYREKSRTVQNQSEYLTRKTDTSAITANIESKLTDEGIELVSAEDDSNFGVEDEDSYRDYINEVKMQWAGYINDDGFFQSSELAKPLGQIRSAIKKSEDPAKYFALVTIDYGSASLDPDRGMYRCKATCNIKLWDLNKKRNGVVIGSTTNISFVAFGSDFKEAQRKAGEMAAKKVAIEMIDRIHKKLD